MTRQTMKVFSKYMTITKITNEQKSKNIDGIIDFHKQQLQLKYMA